MKILYISMGLCISISAYALPCPNGKGIIYKGDSIAEIVKQCGEPNERKTEITQLFSQSEWYYNRPHVYDSGYSQIIFLITNYRISRITIIEHYPIFFCQRAIIRVGAGFITEQSSCGDWTYTTDFTNYCGTTVGINDDIQRLTFFCGSPDSQRELQNTRRERTVFIYTTHSPQLLIFENDRLSDIK